jgi:hypothetical protein
MDKQIPDAPDPTTGWWRTGSRQSDGGRNKHLCSLKFIIIFEPTNFHVLWIFTKRPVISC